MNVITQYAIAAPLNAMACCSAIAFLVSKWGFKKSIVKVGLTYAIYVLLAFVLCAGGEGLLSLDLTVFNLVLFLFYCAGGICACILIYVFFERSALGTKAANITKRKK